MNNCKSIKNARIAMTISTNGIDTVSFLPSDKDASLHFYALIIRAINEFEANVKAITRSIEAERDEESQADSH